MMHGNTKLKNNCASWASQPQKSVTLLPCPGGRTTKSTRTFGGIEKKKPGFSIEDRDTRRSYQSLFLSSPQDNLCSKSLVFADNLKIRTFRCCFRRTYVSSQGRNNFLRIFVIFVRPWEQLISVLLFPPVFIIPTRLHAHLDIQVVLTRQTIRRNFEPLKN